MDNLFNQPLKDYLLNITEKEPTLLANLKQETTTDIGMANMLCGPIVGRLLQLLVKISQAKHCLEVGTFTGYSALFMAAGLPVDGQLITCEKEENHAKIAQKYFDLSPHGHKITLMQGDATQTIQDFTRSFDFIFIDADKQNYPFYYEKLIPKLRPGGLMAVDNALWRTEVLAPQDSASKAIDALNQMAKNDPRLETLLLAIRDGLLIIHKK